DEHGHAHAAAFDRDVTHSVRYSLSAYTRHQVMTVGRLYQTLIYGSVRTWGTDTFRHSLAHELSFSAVGGNVFSRIELLQRVPAELEIDAPAPLDGRWVAATTLGYTLTVGDFGAVKLGLGGSATRSWLPSELRAAYGGNPWSGKVFLQLGGMDMWGW